MEPKAAVQIEHRNPGNEEGDSQAPNVKKGGAEEGHTVEGTGSKRRDTGRDMSKEGPTHQGLESPSFEYGQFQGSS